MNEPTPRHPNRDPEHAEGRASDARADVRLLEQQVHAMMRRLNAVESHFSPLLRPSPRLREGSSFGTKPGGDNPATHSELRQRFERMCDERLARLSDPG